MPSTASPSNCHTFLHDIHASYLILRSFLLFFPVETLQFWEIHLSLSCLILLMDSSPSVFSLKKGWAVMFLSAVLSSQPPPVLCYRILQSQLSQGLCWADKYRCRQTPQTRAEWHRRVRGSLGPPGAPTDTTPACPLVSEDHWGLMDMDVLHVKWGLFV